MTHDAPMDERTRGKLRAYLLDALTAEETVRIAQVMAVSADWRDALDEERQRLALLDLLPMRDPDRDLTEAVMREIVAAREAQRRRSRRNMLLLACAITACLLAGGALALFVFTA